VRIAEATEELAVGGEASPALGDEGGAQEVGRLRGEAEEDLVEEVVVIQRMRQFRRRQRGSAAAVAHAVAGYWKGNWGMGTGE
jgi:hypothetical protein